MAARWTESKLRLPCKRVRHTLCPQDMNLQNHSRLVADQPSRRAREHRGSGGTNSPRIDSSSAFCIRNLAHSLVISTLERRISIDIIYIYTSNRPCGPIPATVPTGVDETMNPCINE